MADFLSRLVERSAGTAPVARPVVAPLFAPGPAVAADPAPEGPEPVGVVPQDPAPVTPPIPRAPASVLREAPALEFTGPGRVPAPALLAAAPATPEEAAPGTLKPAAAVPPKAPRPGAVHEDLPARLEELPVSAPPTPSGARGLSAVPRQLPAWEESRREDAEIRAVAMPLLRPREKTAPRWAEGLQPRGSEEAPRAPIVRISIGRIEVRAVAPPGPAAQIPAPARKSTGLSLEEYLKPRSRGR